MGAGQLPRLRSAMRPKAYQHVQMPSPGQLTRLPVSANIAESKNRVISRFDQVAGVADTPHPLRTLCLRAPRRQVRAYRLEFCDCCALLAATRAEMSLLQAIRLRPANGLKRRFIAGISAGIRPTTKVHHIERYKLTQTIGIPLPANSWGFSPERDRRAFSATRSRGGTRRILY